MNGGKRPPVVYVANHQLYGLDAGLILTKIFEEVGEMPRGLAHPFFYINSKVLTVRNTHTALLSIGKMGKILWFPTKYRWTRQ